MKLRILYFLGTDADRGGAGRILLNIIRRLDRDRFSPLVMVSREGPITEEMARRGIKTRVWGAKDPAGFLARGRRLLQALTLYRGERPAVIHMNNGCLGWKPAEIPAAWLSRIPVIVHFQRITHNVSPYLRFATLGLTCSEYVARHSDLGGLPAQALYDTVDEERFASGNNLRAELGLSHDHVVLSFVGRARRSKGLEAFVNLADYLPDPNLRFLIATQKAGRTEDSYTMEEVEALAARDPRVLLAGYRPDAESVYQTSDIVVMPSEGEEPCAAVILEAGAAAKPVVATRTGSTPELIEDGTNGILVNKGDLSEMSARLRPLLDDAALRIEMGRNALERIRERHTAAPVRKVEQLYGSSVRRQSGLD